MKRIFRIGTIQSHGGRWMSIYVEAKYESGELSIHGTEGPLSSGHCLGSSGQIDMDYAHQNPADNDYRTVEPIKTSEIRFASGWSAENWLKLLDVWKVWHLNGLRAGCEHQQTLGWDKDLIDPTKPPSFDNLKNWKHPPTGHLTEPCPTCGYKYGTAWLKEEVPQDVIDWLFSLPVADKKPAWI